MCIIVFWEDDFPFVDSQPVDRAVLESAFSGSAVNFTAAADLSEALAKQPELLVLPYGSAFPKSAWPAFTGYLKRGGRWLNLGGAPLTRPVRLEQGSWKVEEQQTAYGKECMIRHTWETPLPEAGLSLKVPQNEQPLEASLRAADELAQLKPERVWALQVLLTGSGLLCAGDAGSSGARQAVLRPVVQAWDGERVLPLGTAVALIDALHGLSSGSTMS